MSALNTALTTTASTHLDVELAMDRLRGNLRLILLSHLLQLQVPVAAMRAGVRQLGLMFLVNHRRHGATRLGAVIRPRLAARLLRIALGRTFGERRRLPLGPALLLVQHRFQFLDPLFGLSQPRFELRVVGLQLRIAGLKRRDPSIALLAIRTSGSPRMGPVGFHTTPIIGQPP